MFFGIYLMGYVANIFCRKPRGRNRPHGRVDFDVVVETARASELDVRAGVVLNLRLVAAERLAVEPVLQFELDEDIVRAGGEALDVLTNCILF